MNNVMLTTVVVLTACGLEIRADGLASEREALAALKACDAIVKVDETRSDKPVVAVHFKPNAGRVRDEDLVHLKAFPTLRSVDLPNKRFITDAGLAHLAGLHQLEELGVNGTKVTAAGVVRFMKGRINLQRLDLTGVPLRDDDLASLKDLTGLRFLNLRESLVTDKGLAHLKRFTKLRELSLMSTRIGDAGLEHLKDLKNLEDLDLDRTAITDTGLEHIKALTILRRLQMAHTAVTDAGLDQLQALSNLKELNLRGTKVTEEGVTKLKQRLPHLK